VRTQPVQDLNIAAGHENGDEVCLWDLEPNTWLAKWPRPSDGIGRDDLVEPKFKRRDKYPYLDRGAKANTPFKKRQTDVMGDRSARNVPCCCPQQMSTDKRSFGSGRGSCQDLGKPPRPGHGDESGIVTTVRTRWTMTRSKVNASPPLSPTIRYMAFTRGVRTRLTGARPAVNPGRVCEHRATVLSL
jgi:hypothetical protein